MPKIVQNIESDSTPIVNCNSNKIGEENMCGQELFDFEWVRVLYFLLSCFDSFREVISAYGFENDDKKNLCDIILDRKRNVLVAMKRPDEFTQQNEKFYNP